jgi:hypothetical protein
MKLKQLQEKVYPTIGELVGQQVPVTFNRKKGTMQFVKGRKGIDIFVNKQQIAKEQNQAQTLEHVLSYTNQMMKETGRGEIRLGH